MPLSSKRPRRPDCYVRLEIFSGAGVSEKSSGDKKHEGWSSFRRILRQVCAAPSWDTAKFNPNYQTLNLERSRGNSGEGALHSVIVAPNDST
jgi:hypothetical protein